MLPNDDELRTIIDAVLQEYPQPGADVARGSLFQDCRICFDHIASLSRTKTVDEERDLSFWTKYLRTLTGHHVRDAAYIVAAIGQRDVFFFDVRRVGERWHFGLEPAPRRSVNKPGHASGVPWRKALRGNLLLSSRRVIVS